MQINPILIHSDLSKTMKNMAIKFASLSSVLLFLSSCGNHNDSKGTAAKPSAPIYPVFTATKRSATLNSDYPATLQGQQNIEIRPKIDGYISRIYIDEGSVVKKGQILFQLDAPQYAQMVSSAAAAISSAEADVSTAELQVNKTKPLVEKKIISHFDLESALFTLSSRKAALKQAKASLANANTNLSYTKITSPVNGVVGVIPYKLGSLITATTTQPLTTISNIKNIYAYFSWNEKQLLEFARHAKGTTFAEKLSNAPAVKLILSDGTEYTESGRVETISGIIDTQTGSAQFRATFANPLGLIRSGGSAIVRIPQPLSDVILIPQKSSYELQGKHFVYVVDAQGKIKNTEIEVMDRMAGQFFVVTSGLKAGDHVILDGASTLVDGTMVKSSIQNSSVVFSGL